MTEKTREISIDTKNLRKGNVIRGQIPNAVDPTKIEKRLLWIRGDNGASGIGDKVLELEDQLLRPEQAAVLDILSGKVGPYDVEGVYTPEQIGVTDPRKLLKDEIPEGLEPIDASKLGPNTVVRLSTPRTDIWPDIFHARLTGEKVIKGRRWFDMEDEFGNLYPGIPEKDVLRGRHDWMRFDGIVPPNDPPK
ncbi:hypothetical protein A3C59_00720 [Candidatus Daviesbacteria bacterium RIFCSPHIGHO2_02_FULL_36_13]|uniref:Uncharacterized protein n=1 Tax=Candidatus Daviesbacteria bacterium RIFCSPHIGHO2_02_FULL_36_13 TaxID=1797768 RepID=A0A1F5JZE1_9BACT|nr:MAG: hypothetical protein A3C59_00720 [Candidatus Daviesbacteria bacterium RIFCSPHIGHO2_02_FULL_36_13]OGE41577.1 MAG: hypothetical protein A3A45_03075 [Candidatus Daviesbacteria bacterium RIFCSPLOWO2_01_FULL_36_8]